MDIRLGASFSMPDWLAEFLSTQPGPFPGQGERMALVLELCRRQLRWASGGPFAAAIFGPGGQLISVGLNRVVPEASSVLHAETSAIMLAQARLGSHDLGLHGPCTLVCNAQPCLMCLGAIIWSGLSSLVVAARGKEDVEAILGFDEGPLPDDWVGQLKIRGIKVQRDYMREEARAILAQYAQARLPVYNSTINTLRQP